MASSTSKKSRAKRLQARKNQIAQAKYSYNKKVKEYQQQLMAEYMKQIEAAKNNANNTAEIAEVTVDAVVTDDWSDQDLNDFEQASLNDFVTDEEPTIEPTTDSNEI